MHISERMENDHLAESDRLAELNRMMNHGEFDRVSFMKFVENLRRHIYIEEEIIFPGLQENDILLKGPISGLEMEHASLWMLTDRILEEDSSRKLVKTPKYLDEISRILSVHNAQESGNIYPKIEDERFPDITGVSLPKDWVCIRLRHGHRR